MAIPGRPMRTAAPLAGGRSEGDAGYPATLAVRTACPVAGAEVMLVHGMASSSRYWGPNLGPLAARYQVVAPDLLGFGQSPKPEHADYGPDEHAALLARVAEAAGVPLVVVGHSLGALLALHLAVRYPDLVRGAVFLAMPFFTTEAEARAQLARASAMTGLQIRSPRAARIVCWLLCHARPLVAALMPALDREVGPDAARDAVLHTWRSASRTVDQVIVQSRPAALLDRLAGERLLFIHTNDDGTAPIANVAAYLRGRPEIELVRLADGGHHPYLRQPEQTCIAIANFVDRLRTAPG